MSNGLKCTKCSYTAEIRHETILYVKYFLYVMLGALVHKLSLFSPLLEHFSLVFIGFVVVCVWDVFLNRF